VLTAAGCGGGLGVLVATSRRVQGVYSAVLRAGRPWCVEAGRQQPHMHVLLASLACAGQSSGGRCSIMRVCPWLEAVSGQ
jgi:hypothetical protein